MWCGDWTPANWERDGLATHGMWRLHAEECAGRAHWRAAQCVMRQSPSRAAGDGLESFGNRRASMGPAARQHSEHGHFAWAQLFCVQRESSAALWHLAIVPSTGPRVRAWAWGDADLSAACARRNGALTSQGQPRTASRGAMRKFGTIATKLEGGKQHARSLRRRGRAGRGGLTAPLSRTGGLLRPG